MALCGQCGRGWASGAPLWLQLLPALCPAATPNRVVVGGVVVVQQHLKDLDFQYVGHWYVSNYLGPNKTLDEWY